MPLRLGHRQKLALCKEHMMGRTSKNGRMKNSRLVYSAVALLVGVLAPASAFAQSDSSNQNVQELRKQLDELREQMSKLQARLGELESTKSAEVGNSPAAPSAKPEGTIESTHPQIGRAHV